MTYNAREVYLGASVARSWLHVHRSLWEHQRIGEASQSCNSRNGHRIFTEQNHPQVAGHWQSLVLRTLLSNDDRRVEIASEFS